MVSDKPFRKSFVTNSVIGDSTILFIREEDLQIDNTEKNSLVAVKISAFYLKYPKFEYHNTLSLTRHSYLLQIWQ